MDQFEAFFSGGFIKPKTISGGSTGGRVASEYKSPSYREDKVPEKTTKYAAPFVNELRDLVWKRFDRRDLQEQKNRPETSDIYQKYDFKKKYTTKLPIDKYRGEILAKIEDNPVVILRGPTGCGKTTRVPQFILDSYKQKGRFCNIVVAQPRRIAASSNAKRVCKERGWQLGSIVGYQVGADKRQNRSDDTRVLFCTTGVLVETIIHSSSFNPLDQFSHIILDEVHERDKDMDFLMIAIYKYLSPKIRVVLMSATIDVEKFAKYYEVPSTNMRNGMAPIIELDDERPFDVTTIFLDDIERLECDEDIKSPDISEQMYRCALRLIVYFERIDRMHSEARGVDSETYERQPKPTVLVFLPGIYEIKQMYQRLEEWVVLNNGTKILRIVMHSTGDPMLCDLAMQASNKNTRKVILTTNIAESSITVPDVKYVIDFCLTRNLIVNPQTGFPSLQLEWASRDNCQQRTGRTGRVMHGWCFRLVSQDFYFNQLRQSALAELVTSPLEHVILKTKQLNLGSPEQVLALALDKPYLDEIHNAVLRLKEMGAMLITTKGKTVPRDGDITYIGEIMSRLPIDVKLSKLVAIGYCFGVLEECIIIASALNCSKHMFTDNKMRGIDTYKKLLEFADGSGSDLFALLNAYNTWQELREKGEFGVSNGRRERDTVRMAEKKWADQNLLEIAALRECAECVKELRVRIQRMNLIDCNKSNVRWSRNEKYIVLKVVIAGAFYPNYFSRSTNLKRSIEAQAVNKLGGRDLSDTVYFSGIKPYNLPHIYIKQFKDFLIQNKVVSQQDAENIIVSHDCASEKVYVTFKKSGKEGDIEKYGVACQPGFVLTEVYKAIKLRHLQKELILDVLVDRDTAVRYASSKGLTYTPEGRVQTKTESEYDDVIYPRKCDKFIKGYITHTENCGRFWFQPSKYLNEIRNIDTEINNRNSDLEEFRAEQHVTVGQMVAAVFPSDRVEFYRAKVISIEWKKETKQRIFEVRFIDFGNTRKCNLNELRAFRGVSSQFITLPPYCYQCSLVYIQPSQVNAPDGIWTAEDNRIFVAKTDGVELEIEIFSVVNCIVRAYVRVNGELINQYLIDKDIAEHCEESFMSKRDHIERVIARQEENSLNYLTDGVLRQLQDEDVPTIPLPTQKDGRMQMVKLKGPSSPLEIKLFGLTNSASGSPSIDPRSVNHILLENEPNDMSEKFLVAVAAHNQDKNSPLVARQTTMMPNIRLFGPLMAAIFAPKMKLKRNEDRTHYIRMMTGLGCDEQGVCLSSPTNMQFDLDAELKNGDIITINSIRQSIEKLLSRKCFMKYSKQKVLQIITGLQNDLIKLLAQKRLLIADEAAVVDWEPYNRDDLAEPPHNTRNRFLPPHQFLKLFHPDRKYLCDMISCDKYLRQKQFAVNDDPKARSEKCKICNVTIENGIRLHLLSRQHKDRILAIRTEANQ